MSTDQTFRLSFANDQYRIFAANTTSIAQQLRDVHDLTPLPTIMMARLATAAALIAMDIKDEYGDVSLKIDSEAPLKGGIVIINAQGHLRGYSNEPQLILPDPAENFNVGRSLLPGVLSVIRQDGKKNQFTGIVELESGDIGTDVTNYYMQSEQIPTAVNLGVLIDQHAKVRAAGGFIIQQLPAADPAITDIVIDRMNKTPNISDLMDMGMSIIEIIQKFIIQDDDYSLTQTREICFSCNCSKERFSDALVLLGVEELNTMTDGIEPICHYCNTRYTFTPADIEAIIRRISL